MMTERMKIALSALFIGFFALGSTFAALLAGTGGVNAEPRSAISMHGELTLPADALAFPVAIPMRLKGGRLRAGALGTFDSLNPLIVERSRAA